MSNRTLLAVLAIALALAAATLFVLNKQSRQGPESIFPIGERLLSLDPAKVSAVGVRTVGGVQDRIERGTQPGQWVLRTGTTAGDGFSPVAWRVDVDRMRSVLRVLSEVAATSVPEPDAKLDDTPTMITIIMDDGTAAVLHLASRRLGGQGLVVVKTFAAPDPAEPEAQPKELTSRLAVIADSLHTLFTTPGPRGWRDVQLLPGLSTEASRIRLIGGASASAAAGVALAKNQNKWALREPIGAPADTEAIRKLLSTLESLRITKFFDDHAPTAAEAGLESPTARVIVESDTRAPGTSDSPTDISVSTKSRELTIGMKADPSGKSLYATLDGGKSLVAIDSETLSTISTDPTRYLARTVLDVAAPDIGMIVYQGAGENSASTSALGFRRTVEGWVELRPDGSQVLQTPTRVAAITDLVAFLTSTPSKNVSLEEPTGYRSIGTLAVKGLSAETLEDVVIARSAAPGIVIKSGHVYRTFVSPPALLETVIGPTEPPKTVDPKDITK